MRKIITPLILGLFCIPLFSAAPASYSKPSENSAHLDTVPPLENKQLAYGSEFVYGSLGLIGGYPTVGGGYRIHHGYQGLDIFRKMFTLGHS